ncbi:MAG: Uma2 family endonuclease [Acidobacteriota bacterium]
MTAKHKRFYTLEEYFALVKESEERYEYWNGEIFLMGGASPEHVFIADNLLTILNPQLAGRNCRAMSSDIRIKVPTAPPFRYADVTVACVPFEFEEIGGLKVLVNPILIVEVLSHSSERSDHTKKFSFYQSISSFREYLLISQKEACITQYVKQADNTWEPEEITGLDATLFLPSINCTLVLSEVYRGVDLKGK